MQNKWTFHYALVLLVVLITIIIIGNIWWIRDYIDQWLVMNIMRTLLILLVSWVSIKYILKDKNDEVIDKY